MSKLCVVLLTAILASGCLISSNPATDRTANGQPLVLKSESGTGVETTNEVVGSSTIHHRDGSLSTVEHRADVDHKFAWHDYSFYQGTSRIDEEDFYRLAGDRSSQETVHKRRDKLRGMQKLGLAVMFGAVVLGGGLTALGIANDNVGLAIGGTIGGLLLISPGVAIYGSGRSNMGDKVIAEETAIEAADQVERCVDGNCAPLAPGGRKYRDETSEDAGDGAAGSEAELAAVPPPPSVSVEPRTPSAPLPPARQRPAATKPPPLAPDPTTIVGTWRGTLTTTIAQAGQTPSKQADEVTFAIVAGAGSTVVFWPNVDDKNRKCQFVATLAGTRAQFKPQKVCSLDEDGNTTALSIRSGTLELRDKQVHIELVLQAAIRGKAGAKMTGTITYKGAGRATR